MTEAFDAVDGIATKRDGGRLSAAQIDGEPDAFDVDDLRTRT
jgi:hypothetical protein